MVENIIRLFGDVEIRLADNMVRRVYHTKKSQTRNRGRPRKLWKRSLKQSWN